MAAPAVFLAALCVYLWFAPPDIGWGDGADFVLTAHFLGVPHPTGYPLIALAGKLAGFVPAGTAAFRVGLLSVFMGAAAAAVFYHLAAKLSRRLGGGPAVPLYATAVLMLSSFLLEQAITIEVYTINLFFCLCILALSGPLTGEGALRSTLMLVLVACIGLGNHGTLIFPALLLGVIGLATTRRGRAHVVATGAFLVAAGFTLYLCLPLFSARTDVFDWNSPASPANFPALLSGFDFWVVGEYRAETMWSNAKLLAGSIGRQSWPLLIAGVLYFAISRRVAAGARWTLAGVFALSAFFPVLYPTHEKEAFFLIAYAVFLLAAVAGAAAAVAALGGRERGRAGAATAVVFIFAAAHIFFLRSNLSADKVALNRTDRTPETYTRELLRSARRDALIFIDHVADDTIAPPLYYQFARGMRRDAFLFYRLYLAFPWWRDNMRARAAQLGDGVIIPEIDFEKEKLKNYRISLEEFNRLQEGKTLNTVSIDIQTKRIHEANAPRRPVYMNTPARFRRSVISEGIPVHLSGFLFRLGGGGARPEFDAPAPSHGVYDSVMFDYFSERAYNNHSAGDAARFAAALEKALEYEDRCWVYGELAGAYRQLGDRENAQRFLERYNACGARDFLNDTY